LDMESLPIDCVTGGVSAGAEGSTTAPFDLDLGAVVA
jgi:hypothetical protein